MKEANFTEEEKKLWIKIGEIFGDFQGLDQTHPSDIKEVVDAVHVLQHIMGQRLLRREYPGSFASFKAVPNPRGGYDWMPRKVE